MELTENNVEIEQHMNGYYIRFGDKNFNKSKGNLIQLKQQILENEEIVRRLLNSRDFWVSEVDTSPVCKKIVNLHNVILGEKK